MERKCVGRSLGNTSDGLVLDITGRQLTSGRDCLRDNDWQVYKLSIFGHGKRPVRLLASKTGGDAAKLIAPMEMHGSEEDDFREHLADCSAAARLEFCCSTISVSHSLLYEEAQLNQEGAAEVQHYK